jgi:type IV pilus assembly protein PilA
MRAQQSAGGFTLIELLIVVAVIAILAGVAVPALLRARQSGNEASAIGTMRLINGAQAAYGATCGGGGYAQALADLGKAPASGVPFISADVAIGTKSGYTFVLSAGAGASNVLPAASTCNGSGASSVTMFHALGVPLSVGGSGQRSFATDQRGPIYQDLGGAAIANPIPAGTNVLQ